MDTAWVGTASALAAVAVTALTGEWRARRAFRREKAWTLFDEKRRRLEDLYQSLEEVGDAYGLMFAHMWLERPAEELDAARAKSRPIPWARLRMLVNLYMPELRHHLAIV